jgi:hypothetical protein
MSEKLTEHTLEKIIAENSRKNADLYSEFIGNWFKERMQEIEVYSNTSLIKTLDWNSIEPYLKREVSDRLDIFDHFMVADSNGNYSTTLKRNVGSANDRDYFKAAMEGRAVVSNPVISKSTRKPVTVVAAPIMSSNGKVEGVMAGAINLIKLSRIIENLKYNYPNS